MESRRKSGILKGVNLQTERRPSLRKFARMVGVSPATVSRVFSEFSEQRDLVAPETRDRIIEEAEKCGFRLTAINRISFGGRTNSVGVMVPLLRISYFADITAGLQQKLLEVDILPMILQSTIDDERRSVRRLLDHRVDAMILVLADESLNDNDYEEMRRADVPILLVDNQRPGFICDSALTDDIEGGRLAGRHLIELGHKRIGFCYYGEGRSTCEQRLQGFREALAERDLELREEDIAVVPPGDRQGKESLALQADLRRILSNPSRPTAFFAPIDDIAVQVMKVAREVGLCLPQDLSLVGYADLDYAATTEPPLTTIRQDGFTLGQRIGEMLLHRLGHPDAAPQTLRLPTELIVRQSAVPLSN
jgi:LacI family transcriptional regulator